MIVVGALVISMTCDVCRGRAAVTTVTETSQVTTTGDRSGTGGTETRERQREAGLDRLAETSGTDRRDQAGPSLTPGPPGSGARAARRSRLPREIGKTPLGRGRGPVVTEMRGGRVAGGQGGRMTDLSGTRETRGRWRRGGSGTRPGRWTRGDGRRRRGSRRLRDVRQRFGEKKRN